MIYTGKHVTKNYKTIPPCGTKNGYDYHRRGAVEEACEPCREAMKLYWVEMRRKRGPEMHRMRMEREGNNPFFIEARQRRARKGRAKRFGVDHDGYTTQDVLDNFGTDCHICNEAIDLTAPRSVGKMGWESGLHIDHVFPISRGGTDTLDNVRPAHAKCNIKKSATILEDYKEK